MSSQIAQSKSRAFSFVSIGAALLLTVTGCARFSTHDGRIIQPCDSCWSGIDQSVSITGACDEVSECECCQPDLAHRLIVDPMSRAKDAVVCMACSVRGAGEQCSDRVHGWCADAHAWRLKKKRERNPPPHPRFHPVPVKPVFAHQPGSLSEDPEFYGRFGVAPVDLDQ